MYLCHRQLHSSAVYVHAEGIFGECHYANCRYAECRGAKILDSKREEERNIAKLYFNYKFIISANPFKFIHYFLSSLIKELKQVLLYLSLPFFPCWLNSDISVTQVLVMTDIGEYES